MHVRAHPLARKRTLPLTLSPSRRYVIFFSSPGHKGFPLLEVLTFLVGGPGILLLGGVAEYRWKWLAGNRQSTTETSLDNRFMTTVRPGSRRGRYVGVSNPARAQITISFRVIFAILLCSILPSFLRLRKLFANHLPNIGSFVTDIVCSSALRAMIPVGYVCFSSLGCIIDHGVKNTEISASCIQELSCNVGVALHLVGVCVFQPFLLRPFHTYTLQNVTQFELPLKEKCNLILLTISSAASMNLFAWRSFYGWDSDETMYVRAKRAQRRA